MPDHKIKIKKGENIRLLHQPFLLLTIFLIFLSLIIFILLPIFNVLKLAFTDNTNGATLDNLLKILNSKGYIKTFFNSMKLGAAVAAGSTLIGYLFAYTVTRTSIKFKGFFRGLATLPIISPPFVLSLSIIFLFGRQGIITNGLLGLKNFNIYGMHSLVIVQILSNFPIAFMTLTGILGAIDPSVEDAAYNMGASRGQIFRTITLPLSAPGIVSALLLTFIQSLEDFANPAVIGGNFSTLAVEAYRLVTGMNDMHGGSMMAIVLLLPTVCAFLLQKYWVRNKSFVTVTGKPTQARKELYEKHIVYPLTILCCLIAACIIMFYGTVFAGAFIKTWGYNWNISLDHFKYVMSLKISDLTNSVQLALLSAPIGGLLGIGIAYLTTRKRFPGRRAMELISMLSFAIPGTVLGIGYVFSFNQKPLLLTGTAMILVAAFTFRNMPVAIESGGATLMQIDRSIEEASVILGADDGMTFRRIILPMLKQPFFSGMVFAFVRAMTAVSTVIFLVSPKWSLATTTVYSLFDGSKYGDAAAYVLLMITIIFVAMILLKLAVHIILTPRIKKHNI